MLGLLVLAALALFLPAVAWAAGGDAHGTGGVLLDVLNGGILATAAVVVHAWLEGRGRAKQSAAMAQQEAKQSAAMAQQEAVIERLRTSLARETAVLERKLAAHERLWELAAAADRAQETLTTRQEQFGEDPRLNLPALIEARKALKNFAYDRGIYLDRETYRLIKELDDALGNRDIKHVRPQVGALQEKLRQVLGSCGADVAASSNGCAAVDGVTQA
jgi:small-conductance mechanosensitive channel